MVSLYLVLSDYFKNNENIIKIKEKCDTQENSFSSTLFSKEDILKVIKSLSSNKAFSIEDIPHSSFSIEKFNPYLLRKTYYHFQ